MENFRNLGPVLPLNLLKEITDNFSKDRLIGRGVYGDVYKGVFRNGEVVAVRTLHPLQGIDDEQFQNQCANLVKLKHKNIVRLIGYCSEEQHELSKYNGRFVFTSKTNRMLCFEYLQNGSLAHHISDISSGLDWTTRYSIIKGVCEGLGYLHDGSKIPAYHMDLKPSNILLDQNMSPKISDFGLHKLFDEGNVKYMGEIAHMPPEFTERQIISCKFDIYSMGVAIIELMTGSRPGSDDVYSNKFANLVRERWRERLQKTVNGRSLETYYQQVTKCLEIAMQCVEYDRHKRPSIGEIVNRLNEPESTLRSKGSITSRLSSGHSEANRSTHSNKYFSAMEPRAMTLKELNRMTDGFSEERLLGKGGYGRVYKGVLDNGEVIAVKKLYSNPGLHEENFMSEVWNLMRVQHLNIIRLVGYCSETQDSVVEYRGRLVVAIVEERALCLEYMEGGSLEEILFDESCGLDWDKRSKIIEGVCQGLQHLHTGSKDPIYHMDLKPSNILLDKDQIPKIGDFGLSRLLPSTGTFATKTFPGTLAYMPPEYVNSGQISSKFDVFSLGVIMIQVIAGREGYYKCTDMNSQEFIHHVTKNWRKRLQSSKMLPKDLLEIQNCTKLALRCIESNRANRPTVTEIVEELNMIL
ncbi:unnamed protein product [Alopecurus aequalis]